MSALEDALNRFSKEHRFDKQGPLCVALIVTQHARRRGLPLDPDSLVTQGGGQVLGLGKSAVQKVLRRHGIDRVLAAEGGRTSRGSLQNMRTYVEFLNELAEHGDLDLDGIEAYWIKGVRQFFAGKPFTLRMDPASSLRFVVGDILEQAIDRQKKGGAGTMVAGAVLQHLVGAKLELALGTGKVKHSRFTRQIEHYSFSTADSPRGRKGDFLIGDVAIHVTTAPGEAVIERCRENLREGLNPILVTAKTQVAAATGLAEGRGIDTRLDIFEVEQFVALNLHELAGFETASRQLAVGSLIECYNAIIENVETDPSLRIEFQQGRKTRRHTAR